VPVNAFAQKKNPQTVILALRNAISKQAFHQLKAPIDTGSAISEQQSESDIRTLPSL